MATASTEDIQPLHPAEVRELTIAFPPSVVRWREFLACRAVLWTLYLPFVPVVIAVKLVLLLLYWLLLRCHSSPNASSVFVRIICGFLRPPRLRLPRGLSWEALPRRCVLVGNHGGMFEPQAIPHQCGIKFIAAVDVVQHWVSRFIQATAAYPLDQRRHIQGISAKKSPTGVDAPHAPHEEKKADVWDPIVSPPSALQASETAPSPSTAGRLKMEQETRPAHKLTLSWASNATSSGTPNTNTRKKKRRKRKKSRDSATVPLQAEAPLPVASSSETVELVKAEQPASQSPQEHAEVQATDQDTSQNDQRSGQAHRGGQHGVARNLAQAVDMWRNDCALHGGGRHHESPRHFEDGAIAWDEHEDSEWPELKADQPPPLLVLPCGANSAPNALVSFLPKLFAVAKRDCVFFPLRVDSVPSWWPLIAHSASLSHFETMLCYLAMPPSLWGMTYTVLTPVNTGDDQRTPEELAQAAERAILRSSMLGLPALVPASASLFQLPRWRREVRAFWHSWYLTKQARVIQALSATGFWLLWLARLGCFITSDSFMLSAVGALFLVHIGTALAFPIVRVSLVTYLASHLMSMWSQYPRPLWVLQPHQVDRDAVAVACTGFYPASFAWPSVPLSMLGAIYGVLLFENTPERPLMLWHFVLLSLFVLAFVSHTALARQYPVSVVTSIALGVLHAFWWLSYAEDHFTSLDNDQELLAGLMAVLAVVTYSFWMCYGPHKTLSTRIQYWTWRCRQHVADVAADVGEKNGVQALRCDPRHAGQWLFPAALGAGTLVAIRLTQGIANGEVPVGDFGKCDDEDCGYAVALGLGGVLAFVLLLQGVARVTSSSDATTTVLRAVLLGMCPLWVIGVCPYIVSNLL